MGWLNVFALYLDCVYTSTNDRAEWATDFKDKAPAKNFTILLWTDRTFTNFLEGVGLNSTVLEDLPRMEAIIRNHILLDSKDVRVVTFCKTTRSVCVLPVYTHTHLVRQTQSYKDGTEVKTALPGHSLTVYNVDEQVCFSSWSYGCSQGKKLDLGYICQGAFARVNSILMPSASAENSTSATGMLEATNTNGAIGVAG